VPFPGTRPNPHAANQGSPHQAPRSGPGGQQGGGPSKGSSVLNPRVVLANDGMTNEQKKRQEHQRVGVRLVLAGMALVLVPFILWNRPTGVILGLIVVGVGVVYLLQSD